MYERLSDDRLREMLCVWDDRNPLCHHRHKELYVMHAPCGTCRSCTEDTARMANELLERREADKAVDGACRLAWKNGAPWPIP